MALAFSLDFPLVIAFIIHHWTPLGFRQLSRLLACSLDSIHPCNFIESRARCSVNVEAAAVIEPGHSANVVNAIHIKSSYFHTINLEHHQSR